MKKRNRILFASRPKSRIHVLVGRMKHLRKNMRSDKQVGAPNYASPSSSWKRMKQQKMKSLMQEETKTNTSTTLMLSIKKVPITVTMTNATLQIRGYFFASFGNGGICAVGCCTES